MLDELASTLSVCNSCGCALTEDEKIINARFIQQAASTDQDTSVFPICIKCNFDQLVMRGSPVKRRNSQTSVHSIENPVDVPDVAYLTNSRVQAYPIGQKLKIENQLVV